MTYYRWAPAYTKREVLQYLYAGIYTGPRKQLIYAVIVPPPKPETFKTLK